MCKIKIPKDKKLFLIYLALFITEHKKQEKNNKRVKNKRFLMKIANEGFVLLIATTHLCDHSSIFLLTESFRKNRTEKRK